MRGFQQDACWGCSQRWEGAQVALGWLGLALLERVAQGHRSCSLLWVVF